MTNQEINQLYWTLPAHVRLALDLLLAQGHQNEAAALIITGARAHEQRLEPGVDEALEWAEWRLSLRSMAGR